MNVKDLMTGLIVAALVWVGAASSARAADRVLVLPFENQSNPSYNWLGEGLALMLSDLLSYAQIPAVSFEERRAAYARVGFSATTMLSRASAVRVAQETDAQWLVAGEYRVSGEKRQERVSLTARLINVEEGRTVGEEFTAAAPMSDWLELQGALAWEILLSRRAAPHLSRKELADRAGAVPQPAFEYYVKARLTEDPEVKLKLLNLALKEFNRAKPAEKYPQLLFELGRTYYQHRQFAEALTWLGQMPPGAPNDHEARFYMGLAYHETGDLNGAIAAFEKLLTLEPAAEVYNNLGAAELKAGKLPEALAHFSSAITLDEENADARFNYGYALWLDKDYENAIVQFRHVLRRRSDAHAHYLLGKCWQKLGRDEEARAAMDQARKLLLPVAQWESLGRVPMLARFQTTLGPKPFAPRPARTPPTNNEGTSNGSAGGAPAKPHPGMAADGPPTVLPPSARSRF
jgi:tetratricopeptide (TPR) repeat protein